MHLFRDDKRGKGYQDFEAYENSESRSEADAEFKFDNPYSEGATDR